MTKPLRWIWIGFGMVFVGGIVLPFLMVIRVISLTTMNGTLAWILIFGSYGMSVSGLFLGIIGTAYHVRLRNKPE